MAVWMSVKSASRQSGGPSDGATTNEAVYRSVEHAIGVLLSYVSISGRQTVPRTNLSNRNSDFCRAQLTARSRPPESSLPGRVPLGVVEGSGYVQPGS